MAAYFIWKNINSSVKNIMVNKLPDIERPIANIEKITVPGRDGFLTVDDNTYQGMVKTCECSLDNGDINDICSWLTGTDFVIFSNEPDKKYKAAIINRIPFAKIIPTFQSFIIQFECQPGKYSTTNNLITLTTSPAVVSNPGNKAAKPVIKVYGSDSIDLTINSTIVHLTNVVDYITIDSELMDAYKDTAIKNFDMNGEFPLLIPGANNISWSGTVTKIEILPNFRWL